MPAGFVEMAQNAADNFRKTLGMTQSNIASARMSFIGQRSQMAGQMFRGGAGIRSADKGGLLGLGLLGQKGASAPAPRDSSRRESSAQGFGALDEAQAIE